MFSFLAKTKTPNVSVETMGTKKKYSPEIEAIHHEFFTASDKLLAEANGILEEAAKINRNKIDRLLSLGFKQTREVEQTKPVLAKAELTKEQVELVRYYAQQYPLHKFITEEQVKGICQRWGLVCGGVDLFKGFIPEKNLKEIERFKLKAADVLAFTYTISGANQLFNPDTDLTEFGKNYLFGPLSSGFAFITGMVAGEGPYSGNGLFTADFISKYSTERYVEIRITHGPPSLQICAPIKDMDLTGMAVKNGYKVEKEIPDPVVLQPVRGGYLILTAWGPEASDPDVINEKMN